MLMADVQPACDGHAGAGNSADCPSACKEAAVIAGPCCHLCSISSPVPELLPMLKATAVPAIIPRMPESPAQPDIR